MGIIRIISGGQTGADRAALDVAIDAGIEHGGWVPKGRLAEDGVISNRYFNLKVSNTENPDVRTKLNVQDSDATLIISHGPLYGGSKYTEQSAIELNKPYLHLDLNKVTIDEAVENIRSWLKSKSHVKLNVAGPRVSDDQNVYVATKEIIRRVLMTESANKLTAALSLRDSTLNDLRNWDQIRWQVPYWYCTLATAGAAVLQLFGSKESEFEIQVVSGAVALFGVVCFLLLINLVRYEKTVVNNFNTWIDENDTAQDSLDDFKIDRPYDFRFPCFLTTATFAFFVYMLILTSGFTITAFFGMWWKSCV